MRALRADTGIRSDSPSQSRQLILRDGDLDGEVTLTGVFVREAVCAYL